jgi:hypothetical protein
MDYIKEKYARQTELRLYIELSTEEMKGPDGKATYFIPREENSPHKSLLIFLKYYDPETSTISLVSSAV